MHSPNGRTSRAALHALTLTVFYHYGSDTCLELGLKSVGFNAQTPGLNDSAVAEAARARHLFQIAEAVIRKIDPKTGEVLATIPAPGEGGDSGLAWAEGSLWVGQHRGRKIHQVGIDRRRLRAGLSCRRRLGESHLIGKQQAECRWRSKLASLLDRTDDQELKL